MHTDDCLSNDRHYYIKIPSYLKRKVIYTDFRDGYLSNDRHY